VSESTGEELPPVVAALEGNDESFLAMLERDVAAAEAFSADLQAALSGAGQVSNAAPTGSLSAVEEEAVAAQEASTEALDEIALSADETLALLQEAEEAMFEQLAATVRQSASVVEEETVGLGEVVDQLYATVQAGAMSASAALNILAGVEEQVSTRTVTLSQTIAQVRGSWAAAAEAVDAAGTSEANLTITTGLLIDAEGRLTDANTMLMLAYDELASGADVDFDSLRGALQEVADAQEQFAASTQAIVEAQTEVNLAVVQADTAFMDEAFAMRDLAAAAEMTGVEIADLDAEITAGNYALLSKAAADAQATLTSIQLAEAEQQLAAANLTLIGTFQRLAEGEDVSAEAQAAALKGVKSAESDVNALSGSLGNAGKSAEEAASGFGGMASIMYGPWAMAAYGAMMILPMLGGMFSSNAVTAAQFTQAVSQDSNAVGDNTAATIQQTLAKSNLAGISKELGLSQAQLIEYAAGEKDVQEQVTKAYEDKQKAYEAAENAGKGPESGRGAYIQANQLADQKAALDAVTSAVQQAIAEDQANSDALLAAEQSTQIYTASVNALGSQMMLNVEQTQMSNQATAEYGDRLMAAESTQQYMNAAVAAGGVNMELQQHATEISNMTTIAYGTAIMGAYRDQTMFNAALQASYVSMQEQAQTTAQNSVGLLNLGSAQGSVNNQLVMAEDTYTQAQQGANAYSAALTALNGTTNTLLGSEAAFTTSLAGLTTAVKSNGDSLDVNTAKGAANITAITGIATAAQTSATAVYQNDIATGNAANAYQDATNKLQQEKDAFEKAAEKAGMNKTAVQQLADELFKLPPNIQINTNLDTQPAESNLAQLLERINTSSGTVTVYENSAGEVGSTRGGAKARAGGGPVQAGQLYHINEEGDEGYWVPPADGYVVPHDAMAAIGAGTGSAVGSSWTGAGGGGSGSSQVVVHVYLDGREIAAETRAESQQYKNHNGITGYN
jgi:hypothetical protein